MLEDISVVHAELNMVAPKSWSYCPVSSRHVCRIAILSNIVVNSLLFTSNGEWEGKTTGECLIAVNVGS